MKKNIQKLIFSFIIILVFSVFENVKAMETFSEDEDFPASSSPPKNKTSEEDPEIFAVLQDLKQAELFQQEQDRQIAAKKQAKEREEKYSKEEAKSEKYTLYSVVMNRSFQKFQEDCQGKQSVMVVGTGYDWLETHTTYKVYPKNTYLVDYNWRVNPDLLMSVEIEPLPIQLVGQFDTVVFEGFQDCYNASKAFSNVNKMLKIGGIFLIWDTEKFYKANHCQTLSKLGFSVEQFIENIQDANCTAKDYVGGGCWSANESFLMAKKSKDLQPLVTLKNNKYKQIGTQQK